jgi:REP element-mobilizing transposase RayT
MNHDPLAYFITWTVYGTFLQGDSRWWSHRRQGKTKPQPRLEQWHRHRLKHDVLLLTAEQRPIVETEICRLCDFRGWHLWTANPRTNHIHVVVTAALHSGTQVRDQLKANCTRVLRERYPIFKDRPVWSVGGDWKGINAEDDLEAVVEYATDVQDRKSRDLT